MPQCGDGLTTLLIGLDGACHPVLAKLGDGELRSIQGFAEAGVSAPLHSQIPPTTASVWTSIRTGMNPGKHGIFDICADEGDTRTVVDSSHCRERSLWELLSLAGYTSVVVNAPVTHPPVPFDGAIIPGNPSPEPPDCHPVGLVDHLEDRLGRSLADDDREPADRIVCLGEAFLSLVDQFEPDFGFLRFQQTDTIFHERPHDWQSVRDVYRTVDAEVGRIVAAVEPSNLFIVSGYGTGPVDGVEFQVNEFLSGEGYVTTTRKDTVLRDRRGTRADRGPGGSEADRGILPGCVHSPTILGHIATRIRETIDRVGHSEPIAPVTSGEDRGENERIDWQSSLAYVRSGTECGIRISLAGRDSDGIVEPREYNAVRQHLIERLNTVTTPAGTPLFEAVLPREAVFFGPAIDEAVDIVTIPTGFDHVLSTTPGGPLIGEPRKRWNHKPDGLIIGCGSAFTTANHIEGGNLLDVAPTILATFGVPADERMDGACLAPIVSAGRRSYGRAHGEPSPPRVDGSVTDTRTSQEFLPEE